MPSNQSLVWPDQDLNPQPPGRREDTADKSKSCDLHMTCTGALLHHRGLSQIYMTQSFQCFCTVSGVCGCVCAHHVFWDGATWLRPTSSWCTVDKKRATLRGAACGGGVREPWHRSFTGLEGLQFSFSTQCCAVITSDHQWPGEKAPGLMKGPGDYKHLAHGVRS